MNIGDKVRLIHAKEEGVIVRIIDNKLVEVEIEDGFRIPVLRNEVAVIAAEEAAQFKRNVPQADAIAARTEKGVIATQGVYMAFTIINDTDLALYLVNNTDLGIPFTMGEMQGQNYKGLLAGTLQKKTSVKIHEVSTKNFENWPVYMIQLLFFKEGAFPLREPLTKKIRFRANTFFKSKQPAPLLGKDAYLFQLDKESVDVQPDKILDGIFDSKSIQQTPLPAPAREIDLHIEKLTKDYNRMGNSEILQLQLKTFENNLDQAVAHGMDEIVFIHGVGNGILRMEIHKRLGKHPYVQFFKDAMKEKFGYGATLVKLK
ncbi:DUF2027 domain-containing protein [Rhodocytophaga aerolata]|uniref:DUF2027 domain-containing protein n=1 Tax=Rhodocytophaga aerolata TaxID=455078 RepID=A0ABT8RIN8_9BACT|nr:DUF2027 domain-containing protein [Rhodocytophaga aerolata]MDO1451033.1 DUF2027 domain-containing protein [Rhodocytophaga aerolata]